MNRVEPDRRRRAQRTLVALTALAAISSCRPFDPQVSTARSMPVTATPYTGPSADAAVLVVSSPAASSPVPVCTAAPLAADTSRLAIAAHCVADPSGRVARDLYVVHGGVTHRLVRFLVDDRFFAADAGPEADAAVAVLDAPLDLAGVRLDGTFATPLVTLGFQPVDAAGNVYDDLDDLEARDRSRDRSPQLTACAYEASLVRLQEGFARVPCRLLPGASGGPTVWTGPDGVHHLAGLTSKLLLYGSSRRPYANDVTPVSAVAAIVAGSAPIRVLEP